MSCSKVFEPRGFRAFFAARWGAFLRENYRNPEEVAAAFGVRYQTALNWWQGVNAPSGWASALASQTHAESFSEHMGSERVGRAA